MKRLEDYVRSIKDFPKEGIIFRDITTVLKDPDGFKLAVDTLTKFTEGTDAQLVIGPEARGFMFAAPLAYNLHIGFVPIRKVGKLPFETVSKSYELEYGQAEIEIHKDAIEPGQKVILVDDLLATGGTMEANIKLIEQLGGQVVKVLFLIELNGLGGREKLKGYDVQSAMIFD